MIFGSIGSGKAYTLVKVREEVLEILEECPEARNYDILLQWVFFKKVLGVSMPPLSTEDLSRLEIGRAHV